MTRPIAFPAVAAAAWGAVAALAVLEARGLALPGSFTLCPVRFLTGHLCPGCGMCRSLAAALSSTPFGSSDAAGPCRALEIW